MTDPAALDPTALEEWAREALAAGRPGTAAALGRALATAAPERAAGWLIEALGLVLDGRADAVYGALLPRRRAAAGGGRPGDDLVFLKDVFLLVAGRRAHDAILEAAARVPPDALFSVIPLYFAACVLLERGDHGQGFALLSAVRGRCLANLGALPVWDGDGFMVLFRHTLLVNDPGWTATPYYRQALAANRAHLGPLAWAAGRGLAQHGEGAVLAASCDRRYAERFLPRLLESFGVHAPGRLVHLHLIDPEPEPPPLPVLPANPLALTWERSGPLRCSAWYASVRFVRMAELLDHYRRPVLMFDADVALRHPPEALERALAGADFGCFRMDRLDPGSVYQASVTGFAPTAGGLALARLTGDLILSKMSMQRPLLWLIDQASLFSAITALRDRLRLVDFGRALGVGITDWLEWCDQSEEKLRLMREASEEPAA